jgi:hypothetical protein
VEIVQVVSKGNFMNVLEKCYIYIYIHIWALGKPEGKRPLGRPRHRLENNNNKMDLMKWDVGACT